MGRSRRKSDCSRLAVLPIRHAFRGPLEVVVTTYAAAIVSGRRDDAGS